MRCCSASSAAASSSFKSSIFFCSFSVSAFTVLFKTSCSGKRTGVRLCAKATALLSEANSFTVSPPVSCKGLNGRIVLTVLVRVIMAYTGAVPLLATLIFFCKVRMASAKAAVFAFVIPPSAVMPANFKSWPAVYCPMPVVAAISAFCGGRGRFCAAAAISTGADVKISSPSCGGGAM